jgi:hypothetical protein
MPVVATEMVVKRRGKSGKMSVLRRLEVEGKPLDRRWMGPKVESRRRAAEAIDEGGASEIETYGELVGALLSLLALLTVLARPGGICVVAHICLRLEVDCPVLVVMKRFRMESCGVWIGSFERRQVMKAR